MCISDYEVVFDLIKYKLNRSFDWAFVEKPAAIYMTWYIGFSSSTKQIIVLWEHLWPMMHLWPTLWLKPPTVLPLSSNQAISWERQFDEVKMLVKIINTNCCNTDRSALKQCFQEFRFIYVPGGVSPVWNITDILNLTKRSSAGFADHVVMTSTTSGLIK